MRKTALFCCLLACILPFGHRALAQDTTKTDDAAKTPEPPIHYYHLEFVVQEVSPEGKPVNSRSYSTTAVTRSRERSVIRAKSQIPFAVGTFSEPAGTISSVNTQFQYQNVGVEIDVRDVHEVGRLLTLNLTADIGSMGASSPIGTNVHQPITRQNRWEADVLVPIGKSTVVFSSDDLDNKGSMQMLVTATPLQ